MQPLLFNCSVVSDSLQPHGLQHSNLPCPSPTPKAYSNSSPLSQWCHPAISSSIISFSSLIFPSIKVFSNELALTTGDQSIGASTKILPVNIQGWFPSGLTGFISLLLKGLSKVFSNTAAWKYQSFSAQPSLWSNSHIHTWLLEKSWCQQIDGI